MTKPLPDADIEQTLPSWFEKHPAAAAANHTPLAGQPAFTQRLLEKESLDPEPVRLEMWHPHLGVRLGPGAFMHSW